MAGAEESTQLNWETEATGDLWAPEVPARGRRASRGPGGPGRRGPDRPRVKVKGSWWRHWTLRKALGVLLGVVGGIVVLGAVAVAVAYEKTPVPTEAMAATSFTQSVVYSKDGTLIGRFGTTNRKMLSYAQIQQSKWLIPAVLAAEDRNFFNEGGISPTGIIRAAYSDVRGGDGSLQGGSTITQEFVRQYYSGIGTQQTFSRKIKEIFVAMKVAKEKSKPWILENYLNTIYLGEGAYGIGAAAQTYYNEPVSSLTAAQAAVIAAIIQQPSTYPQPQYRAQLVNRWHYVLNGMVQMGTLTQQQADTMKFPAPGNHVPQTVGNNVWDPYVLQMVSNELKDVYHFSPSQIFNGGYVIRTSLDDAKMAALYQAVRDNEALMNASSRPFDPATMRAGAVLEDPGSGAIQALYPGPGWPGANYNGTGKKISAKYCLKINCYQNLTLTREQVGSSFKPYVLATAVKEGMNVQTSTLDGYNNLCIPPDSAPSKYPVTAIPVPGGIGCQAGSSYYAVGNDSAGENGPYTPQIAMAVSINTAYADLWHTAAGNGGMNLVNMAQAFGVNTDAAGITAGPMMKDQAGVALGQASLNTGRTGHDAGHDRQRRRLPHSARDHRYHAQQRPASAHQDHQLSGVQFRPDAERQHGLPGAVRDVEGRHVLRHRAGRRDEQWSGDHRQDWHHQHRSVGVLHRRHPEPGPCCRAADPRPGWKDRSPRADAQRPRRQFPGRLRRHLADRDLAHLRRGHVRPAGRGAVPDARLHRHGLEPGSAGAAERREAQEARPRPERRRERRWQRERKRGPHPLPHVFVRPGARDLPAGQRRWR